MKLTRAKLVETLRVLNAGSSKCQARKIAGITKQRVYQIWNQYQQTGDVPMEPGRTKARTAGDQVRIDTDASLQIRHEAESGIAAGPGQVIRCWSSRGVNVFRAGPRSTWAAFGNG